MKYSEFADQVNTIVEEHRSDLEDAIADQIGDTKFKIGEVDWAVFKRGIESDIAFFVYTTLGLEPDGEIDGLKEWRDRDRGHLEGDIDAARV